MKASKKAARLWAKNPRKPVYCKTAGRARWIDGDKQPRVPEGGPRRKR